MLRLRHDVTYRTRSEIDNVLAEIEAKDGSPAVATPGTKPGVGDGGRNGRRRKPAPAASRAQRPDRGEWWCHGGGGSNKRLLIIGGAALAVIAVIAIVVVPDHAGRQDQAGAEGQLRTDSGGEPPARVRRRPPRRLEAGFVLWSARPTSARSWATQTWWAARSPDQLRTPKWTLSNPECAGATNPPSHGATRELRLHRGQRSVLHTTGQDQVHRVIESVASFSSPDQAGAFVAASADKWKACTGKSVTRDPQRHDL